MKIFEHFNKNSLHHAYLIEGEHAKVLPEILEIFKNFKIGTSGNPDFSHIELDSFKIDDARNLKSASLEKAVTSGKKVFLISANNFLLEAQNTMLKILEEPIPDTHFFLIMPDANVLLPTFVSRFYVIRTNEDINLKEANEFLKSSIKERVDFLKELLAEAEEEETLSLNSSRARALRFLNSLEFALHQTMPKVAFDPKCFQQIFKVRQFLRQPGSSAKSLMESIALVAPSF